MNKQLDKMCGRRRRRRRSLPLLPVCILHGPLDATVQPARCPPCPQAFVPQLAAATEPPQLNRRARLPPASQGLLNWPAAHRRIPCEEQDAAVGGLGLEDTGGQLVCSAMPCCRKALPRCRRPASQPAPAQVADCLWWRLLAIATCPACTLPEPQVCRFPGRSREDCQARLPNVPQCHGCSHQLERRGHRVLAGGLGLGVLGWRWGVG